MKATILTLFLLLTFASSKASSSLVQNSSNDADTCIVRQTDGFPEGLSLPQDSSYEYECYNTFPEPYEVDVIAGSCSERQIADKSTFFYAIYLYKEIKRYELLLHITTIGEDLDEKSTSVPLSLGEYAEHKGLVRLSDLNNGLKLSLNRVNADTMQVCVPDSSPLKHVFYDALSNFKFKRHIDNIRQASLNNLKMDSIVHSDTVSTICSSPHPQTGTSSLYRSPNLCLQLDADTGYRYYVCGLLLSEGTWEQKGQRIDLHDKHLQHTFHGKVTDQGILSGYLPGDMEGTMLRRVEE